MSPVEFELLDPRYDHEPAYWGLLRKQAGLRADWSWDVLTAQAWCVRSPLLMTVLHDQEGPRGLVCASWVSTRSRRRRFVPQGRGGVGILHVRGPGYGSVPGWWFAGADGGADTRRLLDAYARNARRELGAGMRGTLLRQVSQAQLPALTGRFRLARRTEDFTVMRAAGHRSREEWVATLSKSRRSNLRKIFRTLEEDPTLEIRVGAASAHDHVMVAELLRHNHRKFDHSMAPLPHFTGYLERLLRQPDVFTVSYTDSRSGDLLGLLIVLDHEELPAVWTWSALPADQGGRQNLYFHWYGAMVSWAIEAGKRGYIIGKGMPRLKQTLGAELVPQFAVAAPVL